VSAFDCLEQTTPATGGGTHAPATDTLTSRPTHAAGGQSIQLGLEFEGNPLPHAQEFEKWKATRGGGWILQWLYIFAAPYAQRFLESGRRVSIRLIWERVRDEKLNWIRARHPDCKPVGGYAMNDHFHAHAARHILNRRPEWAGMFETRELQKPRNPVSEIVVRKYR
jgi:hypothetical protein